MNNKEKEKQQVEAIKELQATIAKLDELEQKAKDLGLPRDYLDDLIGDGYKGTTH